MKSASKKKETIWCDHCNVALSAANVRSCIRQDCKTKPLLPDAPPPKFR